MRIKIIAYENHKMLLSVRIVALSYATISGSLIHFRNASVTPEFTTTATALILKCE